ncbi:MAG: hypothetical protein MZW92_49075 [Comamonadaceae bacterium]|nr:hypothetical protein [Comamonadaceae bacterium]
MLMVMMAIERIGATLTAQTGHDRPAGDDRDGRAAARRAVQRAGWWPARVLVLAGRVAAGASR